VVTTPTATYPPVPYPESLGVWLEDQGRKAVAHAVKIAEDAMPTDRKVAGGVGGAGGNAVSVFDFFGHDTGGVGGAGGAGGAASATAVAGSGGVGGAGGAASATEPAGPGGAGGTGGILNELTGEADQDDQDP
jgi:hypothetical protein